MSGFAKSLATADRPSEQRSANMRAVRTKDTAPEMIVRRLVHGLGYRYRLHAHKLPGKPDLVLPKYRAVIFVHGCFWHGHDDCPRARRPKTNAAFWDRKLQRNFERDTAQRASLIASGWRVLVVWECETKRADELGQRVQAFLRPPSR
jgi:DNA mismatch endonuclease (patch repair protein)